MVSHIDIHIKGEKAWARDIVWGAMATEGYLSWGFSLSNLHVY